MNKNRRNFLKILLIGGGILLIGKFLGPRILDIFSRGPKTEKDFGNFRVSEDKKELIISDQTGEEIFIIDKEK